MNRENLKASLLSAIVVLCVAIGGGYVWYLYEYDVPVIEQTELPVVDEIEDVVSEEIIVTEPVEEVTVVVETFVAPVIEGKVVRPFFSLSKSKQEQLDAIIEYNDVFRANYGVDYSSNNLSVVAVASGIVKEVSKDTLFGNRLVVTCGKYIITYQSMNDITVEAGNTIKQGDVIGTMGENVYDATLGKHVHVVVEVNGKYLDLADLIAKKVSIS